MERDHPDESAPPTYSKDSYPAGGEHEVQIPPPGPGQPYVVPGQHLHQANPAQPNIYVAPGQYAPQMPQMQNSGNPNWRYGLCDCFTDASWCLIGFFLPAALVYGIMERTKNPIQGKKVLLWMMFCALVAMIWSWLSFIYIYTIAGLIACLLLLGLYVAIGAIYCYQVGLLRKQTRARYGIEGDEGVDYLLAVCCCYFNCHLCQMFYEVHAREGVQIV